MTENKITRQDFINRYAEVEDLISDYILENLPEDVEAEKATEIAASNSSIWDILESIFCSVNKNSLIKCSVYDDNGTSYTIKISPESQNNIRDKLEFYGISANDNIDISDLNLLVSNNSDLTSLTFAHFINCDFKGITFPKEIDIIRIRQCKNIESVFDTTAERNGIVVYNSNISDISFDILTACNFFNVNLQNICFQNNASVSYSHLVLDKVQMKGGRFEGRFFHSKFLNSEIHSEHPIVVYSNNCHIKGSSLRDVKIHNSIFKDTKLEHSDMRGVKFSNCEFEYCPPFLNVDFRGSEFDKILGLHPIHFACCQIDPDFSVRIAENLYLTAEEIQEAREYVAGINLAEGKETEVDGVTITAAHVRMAQKLLQEQEINQETAAMNVNDETWAAQIEERRRTIVAEVFHSDKS